MSSLQGIPHFELAFLSVAELWFFTKWKSMKSDNVTINDQMGHSSLNFWDVYAQDPPVRPGWPMVIYHSLCFSFLFVIVKCCFNICIRRLIMFTNTHYNNKSIFRFQFLSIHPLCPLSISSRINYYPFCQSHDNICCCQNWIISIHWCEEERNVPSFIKVTIPPIWLHNKKKKSSPLIINGSSCLFQSLNAQYHLITGNKTFNWYICFWSRHQTRSISGKCIHISKIILRVSRTWK